ncbi:MAG: hypothetical protein HOE48_13105 [Candidatus Latescibacteria bacterium]|nr:hypothetical protein [Candidatus Latescibacterota bacterium]MBT4138850.1 hypothetical protein [Candidatus Latescibacterota bacterium]
MCATLPPPRHQSRCRAWHFDELQTVDVLPYDELAISKWNGNPYRADSPTNCTNEDDGTYYLLPYWMGRHYGLIKWATDLQVGGVNQLPNLY